MTKLTIFENSRWRTAAILKIAFGLYLRHLLFNEREILCEEAESRLGTGHVTKIQILKIPDGGRPPF